MDFFDKILVFADLRDDNQFFIDHPGAVPITTAQVYFFLLIFIFLWLTGKQIAIY